MFRYRTRHRHGFTVPELLVATAVSTVALVGLVNFIQINSSMWQNSLLDTDTQKGAQSALQELVYRIRMAREVDVAGSNANRLSVRLPDLDGSGRLVIPQVNGDVYSFYIGDSRGTPQTGGTGTSSVVGGSSQLYLWRAINGTPDTAWSTRNSKGRYPVAPGGLTFSYYPADDPQTVTVTITTISPNGKRTFTSGQEVMLRNKGLRGG